jgi:hypothetical protein
MTGNGPDTLPVGSLPAIARQYQQNTAKSRKLTTPHGTECPVVLLVMLRGSRV